MQNYNKVRKQPKDLQKMCQKFFRRFFLHIFVPMFEIRDFKVEAGDYQRVMWRQFFGRQWPWFALPVGACAVMAAVLADVRWLLAALMVTCLLAPMALVLVYINYALTLEVRWSLMSKTAVIDQNGIHLTFDHERMRPTTIAWSDVASATRDEKAIYLNLKVRRYNFLMIPRRVFDDQGVNEAAFIKYVSRQLGGR